MPGWLAVAHIYAGDVKEAQQLAQSFVANDRRLWLGEGVPDDRECVEWLFADNPMRRGEDWQWFIEGFRKSGLNV